MPSVIQEKLKLLALFSFDIQLSKWQTSIHESKRGESNILNTRRQGQGILLSASWSESGCRRCDGWGRAEIFTSTFWPHVSSSYHSFLTIPAGKQFPLDALVTCTGPFRLCGYFLFFFWRYTQSWSAILPFLLWSPPVFAVFAHWRGSLSSLRQLTSFFFVKVKKMLPDDGCHMSVLFPFSIRFPLGMLIALTPNVIFLSMLKDATLNYSVHVPDFFRI